MPVLDRIVFMQLSDLHIGRTLMPRESRIAAGYNAHDFRLLPHLDRAIAHATATLGAKPPVPIVSCGDLTAGGTDNDYALAAALLHSRWQWSRSPARTMGFGWPTAAVLSAPGNHDHWRDTHNPAAHSDIAPRFFESTPWMRTIRGPAGLLALDVYCVDSNSGLRGKPVNVNPFAGGSIAAIEIAGLDALLRATSGPEQHRLRAVVCHHSFTSSGLTGARPLDVESATELIRLARIHGIQAILTGHTHTFHQQAWPYMNPVVTELRCSTSLQAPAETGVQGFWAHSITLHDDSSPKWQAWKYQWAGVRFELDAANPVSLC